MQRLTVTNPGAGSSARVDASGNAFAIESAPADAVADRNTITPGSPSEGGGRYPLIARTVVELCRDFDYLTINGDGATPTGDTLYILVYNHNQVDIDLPPV